MVMANPTTIGDATLHCGDCREVMAGMDADSVDAIVTDPPAGIAFMGKKWDSDKGGRAQWIAWMETVAAECLRVLKPGGHALVWAIPRTSHWTGMAWENAGWEPREKIYHCFGSGFPKSTRVNRDPRFCQCGDVARNESNTTLSLPQQSHKDMAAVVCDDAPHHADDRHLTNKVVSSVAGYLLDHGFYDAPSHVPSDFCQGSSPSQGYAQEHTHFSLPSDDLNCGSLHSPSQAQCSAHPSSLDCSRQDFSENSTASDILSSTEHQYKKDLGIESPNNHKQNNCESLLAYGPPVNVDNGDILPRCRDCGKPIANGIGTALKPAIEEWWLFRKPPIGTIAQNVLRYGTGGLHIDACRVDVSDQDQRPPTKWEAHRGGIWNPSDGLQGVIKSTAQNSRYPANLIHSGEPEVVGLFPVSGNGNGKLTVKKRQRNKGWCNASPGEGVDAIDNYGDTGSAARFFQCCPFEAGDYDPLFYTGKATKKDRDAGCEGLEEREKNTRNSYGDQSQFDCPDGAHRVGNKGTSIARNHHPTVKPLSLMRYLVRLVTPPNGLILDPFAGSGSTGKAALLEGFRFVGIDLEPEHVAIAKARLEHIQCRQGLFADAS
jgi:DNA modification methylase